MKSRLAFGSVVLAGGIVAAAYAESQANKPTSSPGGPGKLRYVTLVVNDQDEALRWYTEKFGFAKVEDQVSPGGDRWLVVAPFGQKDLGIILYVNSMKRLDPETYKRRIGGETLWVFDTTDAKATCAATQAAGREVRQRAGRSAVGCAGHRRGSLRQPVRDRATETHVRLSSGQLR